MVDLGEKKLKKFIKTIGLYNSKAKNIILLSKELTKKYNSKIPKEFDKLVSLPGVGNKTASVYQNAILKLPRIAVDTHVFRVSNRLGIVKTLTADQTQFLRPVFLDFLQNLGVLRNPILQLMEKGKWIYFYLIAKHYAPLNI